VDDVTLSPIRTSDAGEILTLQRAAYATEAQLYGDPFLPALTQTLDQLHDELATGNGWTLRHDHRLVGAVRTRTEGDVVHIGRLTVAPDLQGRGLGTRLLEVAERDAAAAELFTGHLSAGNLRLYRRRGYRETRREALSENVELVYLRKSLR
jgi:ribosomal protein S18 acetylase RimI-like enzyme